MTEPTNDAVTEARRQRFWRDRCGEPCQHAAPVRCRRDLAHPSPHVGLIGTEPVVWDGAGNATSAQATDHKCFDSMRPRVRGNG